MKAVQWVALACLVLVAGIAEAGCGDCDSGACGASSDGATTACADPGCEDGHGGLLSPGKCCEEFGNIAGLSSEDNLWTTSENDSTDYADYRGNDDAFVLNQYNPDGGTTHPRYK